MTSRDPVRRINAWWLVLTLPVALVSSYFLAVLITLSWCGISGCTGGGYGLVSDPSEGMTAVAGALLFLVWFAAFALPPWCFPVRRRLLVALVVALALTAVVVWWGTGGFART